MLFIDFLSLYKLAFQMYTFIIMKISKSQENHIQTIFYHNRVFIILYSLYCGCCHVYFCCDVTTASPFLSYHVYIPSVIHFRKRIYFHFICLYTLFAASVHYKSSPKKGNPCVKFFPQLPFQNSPIVRENWDPGNTGLLYPYHTMTDHVPCCNDGKKLGSNLIK